MPVPKELSTALRWAWAEQFFAAPEAEPVPDTTTLLREAIAKLDAAVALLKEAQCRDSQN